MANILVCDDDKDIVEAIEIYLTQEGYHILKAYDGQEALDILNSETVDLLIIDVMMPRLDGIPGNGQDPGKAILCPSSSCPQNLKTRTKSWALTSVQMTISPNLSILWS